MLVDNFPTRSVPTAMLFLMKAQRDERRRRKEHPGPVYDAAMHGVLAGDPGAACRLLGIAVTTPSGVPDVLSTAFPYPVGALYADLVMRVGPGRLVHVEFERQLSAEEMVARMMGYRGVIQRRHRREVLDQYLIVFGGGRVSEFIDPVLTWFWRRLGVIFLRDLDPERFLGSPSLAPLAVLTRGGTRARARALGRALVVIHDQGGERAVELRTFAVTLAGLTVDRLTIDRVVKEAGMTPEEYVAELLWEGSFGDEYRQQIRDEVAREVRQEAVTEGREHFVTALMRDRFGPDPQIPAVARRLLARLEDAPVAHAVVTAADLAALADLVPESAS